MTTAARNVAVTAREGAQLNAGATFAISYSGARAMERAQQIEDLQMRIEQLTAIKNGKSNDELANDSILELAAAVTSDDLSELYSIEMNVDAYILSGTELASGNEEEQIAELQAEITELAAASSSDTVYITTEKAGTFSHKVDGFENVTPDDLRGLTTSGAYELFTSAENVGKSVGKMVYGIKWYYVTIMDEEDVAKLTVGGSASVEFSKSYSASLTMTVESISVPEDGKCAVVFSCSKYMQDVAALREMTGEVVFGRESGIRVPRKAVHVSDSGKTYVFILEGLRAKAVNIEITNESGDYYMVSEDKSDLRVGDLIILSAANLYDGAVVAE
jgi:hypothetical protein